MDPAPAVKEDSISAIKIFKLVEAQIREIDTFPLNADNLMVQQDAYKRLANQDEEEEFEVFASLEQDRKEKDADLRFLAQFAGGVFILSIEGFGDLPMAYEDLGATNKEIAQHIMSTLIMLSNGQLSCAYTTRHGRVCATELVYRSGPAAAPKAISVDGSYPRFIRNDDPDMYDVQVLKNDFHVGRVKIPEKFFLHAQRPDGSLLTLNRHFAGNTITPLTKTQYKTIINDVSNTLLGVENDAQLNKKLNQSWILWVLFTVFAAPIAVWLPEDIFYLAPVAGLAAFYIAAFVTGRYMMYLETLQRTKADHPVVKIDRMLQPRNTVPLLYQFSLVMASISLTFPVYVPKDNHQSTLTLFQLSQTLSPLVLLPVVLLIAALVLSFARKRVLKAVSAILSILVVIGLLVVGFGFTYTGDDVATPEPQTTIIIVTLLAQLIFSICMLVMNTRKSDAELQSSAHEHGV